MLLPSCDDCQWTSGERFLTHTVKRDSAALKLCQKLSVLSSPLAVWKVLQGKHPLSLPALVPVAILMRVFYFLFFLGSASALFGQLCLLEAQSLLRSTPQKGAGGVSGQQWTGRRSSAGAGLRHPGCGGWGGGWRREKTTTTHTETPVSIYFILYLIGQSYWDPFFSGK